MAMNIEKLLRMTADYHNFCSNDYAKAESGDPDEIFLEELDLVAAASGVQMRNSNPENEKETLF